MNSLFKLKIIRLITVGVLLTACENEIPYSSESIKPQLIMNALLDAGKSENFVYLHLSEENKIGRLNEASLTLFINDKAVETPQAIPVQEDISVQGESTSIVPTDTPTRYLKFRLTSVFHPGDRIRLEAKAGNGEYQITADADVPQPIKELKVETSPAYLRQYNRMEPYRQYNITLQDLSDKKNYYRLEILNDLHFRSQYYTYDEEGKEVIKEEIFNERRTELINREDMILTDGHLSSYDDETNSFFPTIENKYNIFTDNRFSNSSASLKVYTSYYTELYPEHIIYSKLYRKQTISIRLLTLSAAEYHYLKALNYLNDDDYDNTLMEPISIPTNVKGGLGFVGICAETKVVIEIPETSI